MKILLVSALSLVAVNTYSAQSIADAAKQNRQQQSQNKPSTKVYTNDDMLSGSPPPDSSSTAAKNKAPEKNLEVKIRDLQAQIDNLESKRPRELSDDIVGDVMFPNRSDWEQRLWNQNQKRVSSLRAVLDAVENLRDARGAEQIKVRGDAVQKLQSQMESDDYAYKQLVAEGVKNAGEWARKH